MVNVYIGIGFKKAILVNL